MSALRDEVANDPQYRLVLDNGFVGIEEFMGSDDAVINAARVSYGKGTKAIRDGHGLIRYLMRHSHTTPFEMCEIKFRVRAPIFVVRQWFRHRTASVNEESARYSEMVDEFYFPDPADIAPQSKDNKQGRAGDLTASHKEFVLGIMQNASEDAYADYQRLLGNITPLDADDDGMGEFDGIARELARIIMPLNSYTSFIWKQNLHNLLHFCHLRADPHAQKEIRVYAEAMIDLVRPLYPSVVGAWEDYVRYSAKLSRMEAALVKMLIASPVPASEKMAEMIGAHGSEKAFANSMSMSERELREFRGKWGL